MAADRLRFVDSVVASPTVRLDINDQAATSTSWFSTFEWTPGQLTRAISENAMGDGGNVSSSRRGFGSLRVTTTLRAANQDTLATQFQLLTRELDRETNWVEFRPDGATKSIYLKTYRSDVALIRVVPAQVGMFMVEYEILTDPYGIGLRETISIGTVNNDPAAGSNGCYFDVTGVIGDVPAPPVIIDTVTGSTMQTFGVRQTGTPSNISVAFLQGESAGTLTGFSNPGGAADAAMSGSGTTNYVRSTAATGNVIWTVTGTDAQMIANRGTYRAFVVVRISNNTTDWTIADNNGDGTLYQPPRSSSRQIVDLGLRVIGPGINKAGADGLPSPTHSIGTGLDFNRTSGAGTIDVDYLALIPADTAQLTWDFAIGASLEQLVDCTQESITGKEAGASAFDGTGNVGGVASASGGFPSLVPNQTNRFYWHRYAQGGGTHTISKSDTASPTFYYNPRYIFIRPSTT
jgi:hypothetical protein